MNDDILPSNSATTESNFDLKMSAFRRFPQFLMSSKQM